MTKRTILSLGIALGAIVLFALLATFLRSQSASGFLWSLSAGGTLLAPIILASAIVDSINPCAFSVLLITIAFLLSLGKGKSSVLKAGGAYIAGIFLIYVAIGLGILQTLHLFNTPHFMAKVGAWILIAFGGINLINEAFPAFPIKLRIPASAHGRMAELIERASIPAAFSLGALVGICEFPCTGGPYLLVLGLLHDSATYLRGFGYLMLYNLIFVLPLGIILFAASNKVVLAKVEAWKRMEMRHLRFSSGILMVALGAVILLFS